jgi:capsid protein
MARPRFADSTGVIRSRDEYNSVPSADYDALRGGPLVRQRTGLAPLGSGADWHLRYEIQHLRLAELARDVRRNDMFVGQGVSRLVDNILQGGPTVDPQTGNDEANSILLDGWQEWGEEKTLCHSLQTMNWSQMRRVSLDSMIVDGDIFQVMQQDGSANLLESHRVRKPQNTVRNVVFGILKDDQGRPQEVWFTLENLQPAQQLNNVGATRPIPIRDAEGYEQVMQIVDRVRATQTRGVTKFAPIFKPTTLIDDTVYAQLVKEQVQSCITFLRERPQTSGVQIEAGTAGEAQVITGDSSYARLLQNLFPGLEIAGNPGELLKAFVPAVAGADFINFSMLILCILAVNLDTPIEVFLLDSSRGNFASMRANMMQARLAWQRFQRLQIDCQERPTYLWRVRALYEERSKRGARLRYLCETDKSIDLRRHNWHLPEWEYLDPLKDVTAGAMELATGQTSPRRLANRLQVPWSQLAREIPEDRLMLAKNAALAARAFNDEFKADGFTADWTWFAPQALPTGVTMQINAGASADESPAAEKKEDPNATTK